MRYTYLHIDIDINYHQYARSNIVRIHVNFACQWEFQIGLLHFRER